MPNEIYCSKYYIIIAVMQLNIRAVLHLDLLTSLYLPAKSDLGLKLDLLNDKNITYFND